MDRNHELYSPYIESGIIKKDKFKLFSLLVSVLFKRIELDKESELIVKEAAEKGKIVYASMQTTFTSLYILLNLLRKHNLPEPVLGLGFTPYTYQKLGILYHEIMSYLVKVFKSAEYKFISNHEYIARILDSGSLAFSMLSKRLFVRGYVEIKTDTIEYLLELQKKSDIPIFIFPQVIFWNRNPEKTGLITLNESIGDRGLFSGALTLWKSITPSFVRIGRPVNLKEVLEAQGGDDTKHLSRIVRNNLIEIYNHEKRSVLGPQLKTEQEMMEKVLYHKNVLDAIQQEMSEKGTAEKKLRRKAYKYFVEIAADFSITYIKFFKAAVDYLYSKIFDGIHFNIEDFKRLREESVKGPVILVPSHKSHIDYLVISCMMYDNNFIPPHIVAGANLLFFPMGKIFRKSGAFFMRRTFKGLNLYASVFKQYLKTIINEGYMIEFFIEGGRSRTGKVVKPKMGLLKYLIEAIDEGYNKDLVFVPLTVNYDRILEENSYLKELKGKEKSKESTSGFLKSRKLIKRKYGYVYMGFNETFTLNEIREKFLKEKNITDIDVLTEELGYYIVKQINGAVIVTPFSIVTAAILDTSSDGFTSESIRLRVDALLSYIRTTGYKMADSLKGEPDINALINKVFESYTSDGILIAPVTDDADKTVTVREHYIIDPEQRGRINFYKNSIAHMTLPVNMISLALLATEMKGKVLTNKAVSEFEKIRDLFSMEFIYSDFLTDTETVISDTLSYFSSKKMIKSNGKDIVINDSGRVILKFFAGMIQDYIESYLIVLNSSQDYSVSQISRKEFSTDIRKNGNRMYTGGEVQCSEALSMINYDNAIDKFIKTEIFDQTGEKKHSLIIFRDKKKASELKSLLLSYLEKVRS